MVCDGYGEHLVAGTPTIRFLKRELAVKEPINALTALLITWFGFSVPLEVYSSSRELTWIRYFVMLNGVTSCYLHTVLPSRDDHFLSRFVANLDGTSMLAAVVAALSAIGAPLFLEVSLLFLIFPACTERFSGVYQEAFFGFIFAMTILWLGFYLVDETPLFNHLVVVTLGIIFASVCQIVDQFQPKRGETLGIIRRTIALHAVWHIVAGLCVCELMGLVKEVQRKF